MRVIRCGQKRSPPSKQWGDAEILQAAWELDEQRGVRRNPMRVQQEILDIPILTPIAKNQSDQGNGDG